MGPARFVPSIRSFIPALALALAVPLSLGSCREGPLSAPTDAPLPAEIDAVHLSLGFGDSPVEGELRIMASTPSGWTYAVDLDEDGRAEEVGALHLGVVIPYRYEETGLHRIRVTLEREGERRTFERFVAVNDPTATEVTHRVGPGPASSGNLRAIALDEAVERLFVVKADPDFALIHLDPADLSERWRLPLPGVRLENGYQPTEGIVLAGETLFVDTGDSLVAVDVGDPPRVLGGIGEARWGAHLAGPRDGRIYSGGGLGIAALDAATGAVIRALDLPRFGGGFAVSPDGRSIAYLHDVFQEPVLLLLDAGSLSEIGRLALPDIGSPIAITFHPSGDRVYVITTGPESHMVVVEVPDPRIVKDVVLARGSAQMFSSLDRLGWGKDGRYLVLGSPYGTYFIDSLIDHPRFRSTEDPPTRPNGCCSVAPSPIDDRVYRTDGPDGEVSILRFLR